ncbi:unnamed protein product [Meloidogyne enterolobii]|uniref:Uncharacterized protein n=1 Tax=Meloidogyne enterolobii TaxID=390850 RepID=A0ACB0ZHH0_MELEN
MTEWDYLEEREALKNFDFSQHDQFPQYYGRLVNDNTMDPAYYINMFKNSKASGSSSTNPKMYTTPYDSKQFLSDKIIKDFSRSRYIGTS